VLPVSVAEKVGTVPETGFDFASNKVMVIVEVVIPSATIELVPEIVDVTAEIAPTLKTTVPPVKLTGEVKVSVLVSALVEASVQVEIPVVALELEQVPSVFPAPVFVALKVGTIPPTAMCEASLSVIVIVEVELPSAVTGVVPVIEEFPATTAVGANTTVPPLIESGEVSESVLVSAVEEARVQVEVPPTLVAEHAP
jgi:hypothetical protein